MFDFPCAVEALDAVGALAGCASCLDVPVRGWRELDSSRLCAEADAAVDFLGRAVRSDDEELLRSDDLSAERGRQ